MTTTSVLSFKIKHLRHHKYMLSVLLINIPSLSSCDHEVVDLLCTMNYRVCYDGFYIPSPEAPRPTESPAFTFDSTEPNYHVGKSSNVRRPGYQLSSETTMTRTPMLMSEANMFLMDRILRRQHLQSLPSCQYVPRPPNLRFTLNIAESIMTEECEVKHHSIPDINRKSPNESILDGALDKIDHREDGSDDEEKPTWKAKEEKENSDPDNRDSILNLSRTFWRPHETQRSTPSHPEAVLHGAGLTDNLGNDSESATLDTAPLDCTVTPHIPPSNCVSSQLVAYSTKLADWQQKHPGITKLQKLGETSNPVDRQEKRFVCDICGRAFRQSGTAKAHRRTHTGERPYRCEVCGKSFGDRSTWRKHRRVHTGDKLFTCDICDKTFAQSGNVSRHKKIMHADIM